VSFILNDVQDQKISDATRQSVLKAARDLDYRPNRNARDLASGTSATLLCYIPRSHLNEGSLGLLSELTAELSRRGFTLAVYFESSDRNVLGQLVKELRPRVIFSLYGEVPAWVRTAVGSSVVLAVDPGGELDATDAGALKQVEHLASRGHSAIGFAGIDDEAMAGLIDRRRRTVEASTARLSGGKTLSIILKADGSDALDAVGRYRNAGMTAISCYNDEVAVMLLGAVRRAGLQCPEDLAIIGYDAVPIGQWTLPTLTTIAWDPRAAAEAFAEGIVSLLDPSYVVDPAAMEGAIGAHVVVRESA
jgi:DNA-binding LacI/PurR family transcriptional regulator